MPCAIVSPDVEARYTEVIDSILAKSDLNTISEKRIRKGLQEVVGYDLTPQKVRNAILDPVANCPSQYWSILGTTNFPLTRVVIAGCNQAAYHEKVRYIRGTKRHRSF
jgi:hypothetical protein